MYRMNIPDTKKYTKENRRRRVWRRILSAMASIVVFCTTYALILPAITLEGQPSPEPTEVIVQNQPEQETTAPTEEALPTIPETPGGGTVSADEAEPEDDATAPTDPTSPAPTEEIKPQNGAAVDPVQESGDEQTLQGEDASEAGEDNTSTVSDDEQTDNDNETQTPPLDVSKFITEATLTYKDGDEWKDVKDAKNIPGDAVFKLDVEYGGVSIEKLKAAGYQMTYQLPELLRDAVASGDLTDNSKHNVGTIKASGNAVTLTFNETWINELSKPSGEGGSQEGGTTQAQQVLNGTFYVQATANLSQIPNSGSTSIMIGNVEIKINFEGDVLAKHADITLTKSEPKLIQGEEDYLEYTLTVTAGQDKCLGVFVKDEITAGSDKVVEYCNFEPTSGTVDYTNGKSFTWTIGDMEANTTQTLTYRVKLVKGFLGGMISTEQVVTNKAQAFTSKGDDHYPHGEVSSHYTAKGEATLSKVAGKYDPQTSTIQYTIWVKALESNTYILDHVYIKDALDGSVSGGNVTDENVRKYLSYVEDSFKLYDGGIEKQNGSNGLTEIETKVKPTFGEPDKTNFTYDIGSLGAGECRTLIYTIKVDPGAFMAANNTEIKVLNRATISDNQACENNRFNNYNCDQTIGKKAWSRKMVGAETTEAETIEVSGVVYDTDGKTKLNISTDSFTVPAGSYRYQIIANEAGDWDLSSAVMTDQLTGNYLQYVGYVQVSAYKIDETSGSPAGTNFGTDDQAMAAFGKKTAEKTVWVKIDGQRSFKFSPTDLGMTEKYAYVLTYYAEVVNQGTTNVVVANDFTLTGTVGYGNVKYELVGITARGEVTVSSSNYFAAKKQFWYYDRGTAEEGGNGTLYWILQIDGNPIKKDVQIKDAISSTNHGNLKTVGIYKSSTELTADMTVADLKETEKVSANIVTETTESNVNLVYTINQDISLSQAEGKQEHLYIIVSSVPTKLPSSSWDHETYHNGLYTKSVDQTVWTNDSEVSQTIFGGTEIIKELGEIFTYQDGSKKTIQNGNGIQQGDFPIQTDHLDGNGIYVSWHIRVNQGGTLNGTYRILEDIPKGMKCVYLIKASARGSGTNSTFSEINDLDGWTKEEPYFENGGNYKYALYYVKEQQVMWDIALQNGTPGECYTEFQIVCKVTDPEVLQGGIEKTFTNTVSMTDSDEVAIGTDSDAVSIHSKSLSKTGPYDPDTNSGVYPFEITVNDLGTDLVPGSDEIVLVDELSDTLILAPTSIQVVNTQTTKDVPYTAVVDHQTLKITLPDDQPLTITYSATINAAPGQEINISNKAHWEGYSAGEGTIVKKENFSYSVGGTVGTEERPSLKIIKLDQNNTSLKLSGAEFKLVEVQKDGDDWKAVPDGKSFTGTTDTNGTLTFGKDGNTLEFNTVYCLTETNAPNGYVLDSTPYYFAILQKEGASYPEVPKDVQAFYNAASTYTIYNHKGEVLVEKAFQNAGGEKLDKIDGTYKFGIFKVEGNVVDENPVQTVSITFQSGVENSGKAKFTNLELGSTYAIYELDDNDKPITPGDSAVVSGMPFVVSYSENQEITVTDNTVPTVTVTNRMNYAELPATGGSGPAPLYLSGLALIFAALVLLKKRKTV